VTLSRQGRAKDGESAFREALRLAPELAAAHNNLAYQLAARGASDEARYHFEQALGLDRNYWAAHLGYARLLAAAGMQEPAAEHFRAALESSDDALRREAQAGLRALR